MSVFTTVDREALERHLGQFEAGRLLDFQGIAAGIENTNYFVTTDSAQFVLTLYEHHTASEIDYSLQLCAYLAQHQLPVATPIAAKQGALQLELLGKPAVLFQRLNGRSDMQPSAIHCAALGRALGRIHQVSQQFPLQSRLIESADWYRHKFDSVAAQLELPLAQQLQHELAFQQTQNYATLPHGAIHADLFRDNALFDGDQLSGIIDFNTAGHGPLLYDLAVVLNDWCCQEDGQLDQQRSTALLNAYRAERPFTAQELSAWEPISRLAALRFWLSRLHNFHHPRDGELTFCKDPQEYQQILRQRRDNPISLEQLYAE